MSTAELSKLPQDNPYYSISNKPSPGAWTVVRYKDNGEEKGHAQLNMGNGKYFDSTEAGNGGPRITDGHEVVKYLSDHPEEYSDIQERYYTPKVDESKKGK